MSLAGTAATTVAWYAETQRSRLDILTTWTILVPIFGIVLSVGLLQETQSVLGWTGTAIVIGSVALLTIPIAGKPAVTEAAIPKLGTPIRS